MVNSRINTHHSVFNISYHIVWIPKYRKKILVGTIENDIKKYLFDKAKTLNISIEAHEIMQDHIHLFIKAKSNISISTIVQGLKGYTSFILRKQYPKLKKYKSLWSHSYFCETIGCITENSIKKYIALQKEAYHKPQHVVDIDFI